MSDEILLSLCVPTNGIINWVKPVLDSIYAEEHPVGRFEVIVTDNGDNAEFATMMETYASQHDNLVYQKTDAKQFLNQIEAFRIASGRLLKFVNHRMALEAGALNYLISYAQEQGQDKPVTYFLNGADPRHHGREEYTGFDSYVRGLSYWSSWSAGTAIWREDFDRIDLTQTFDRMFPHTDFLFAVKDKERYVIDNTVLLKDLEPNAAQKGKYDLFRTFAVDYIAILEHLYQAGDISNDTFQRVKRDNLDLVMSFYVSFVLLKRPCSYDLSTFRQSLFVYYKPLPAFVSAVSYIVKECMKKIIKES